MTFITGPYDDLITTKTIDQMYTFRESNCEYLKWTPQNGAFAMVGCGGVLGDENIHNFGWYSEGFGCDTIILGLTPF